MRPPISLPISPPAGPPLNLPFNPGAHQAPGLRIESVESLRGLLAWWVVLGHAAGLAGIDRLVVPQPFSGILTLLFRLDAAVLVFVMLSGFAIAHLRLTRPEPYRLYLLRRALRLWPVYLVCLCLAVLLRPLYEIAFVLNPLPIGQELRSARAGAEDQSFWTHVLLHLSLLHAMVPEQVLPHAATTLLSPAWSLSLEWQFYLVAPVLIALLIRPGVLAPLVLAACILQLWAVRQDWLSWGYDGFLPLLSGCFLIGILTRFLMSGPMLGCPVAALSLLLGVLLIGVDPLAALVWLLIVGALMIETGYLPAGPLPARLVGLLRVPPLRWLGARAYGAYLVHVPVFTLMVGVTVLVFGPEALDRRFLIPVLLVALPAVAGIAHLLWQYVEQPAITFGRGIVARAVLPPLPPVKAAPVAPLDLTAVAGR